MSFEEELWAIKKSKRTGRCVVCGEQFICGIFYHTCSNKNCILHDAFALGKCGIIEAPRRREFQLHRKFLKYHHRLEWFIFSDEIREYLKEITKKEE